MKNGPCKYCGSTQHTSLMCFKKPRRAIKKESDRSKSKRMTTSDEWYAENPPSKKGTWECYLRISPNCHVLVTRSTINLEHVLTKNKHREHKYNKKNLKPACKPCNRLKGHRDLSELIDEFPHLLPVLEAFNASMAEVEQPLSL